MSPQSQSSVSRSLPKSGWGFSTHGPLPQQDQTRESRARAKRRQRRQERQGVDPFQPGAKIRGSGAADHLHSHNRRRWRHIYARANDAIRGSGLTRSAEYDIDWPSLCEPAIFPLTTDYFPEPGELKSQNYTEQCYSLTLADWEDAAFDAAQTGAAGPVQCKSYDELMVELIGQRLSQDFQICVTEDREWHRAPKKGSTTPRDCHLSFSNAFHHLSYDPVQKTVSIKMYTRKYKPGDEVVGGGEAKPAPLQKPKSLPYYFTLWDNVLGEPQRARQHFQGELHSQINWNQQDQIACGYSYDDALPFHSRYRRLSFVILGAACRARPGSDITAAAGAVGAGSGVVGSGGNNGIASSGEAKSGGTPSASGSSGSFGMGANDPGGASRAVSSAVTSVESSVASVDSSSDRGGAADRGGVNTDDRLNLLAGGEGGKEGVKEGAGVDGGHEVGHDGGHDGGHGGDGVAVGGSGEWTKDCEDTIAAYQKFFEVLRKRFFPTGPPPRGGGGDGSTLFDVAIVNLDPPAEEKDGTDGNGAGNGGGETADGQTAADVRPGGGGMLQRPPRRPRPPPRRMVKKRTTIPLAKWNEVFNPDSPEAITPPDKRTAEWATLEYDSQLDPRKPFHLQVQFLFSSGSTCHAMIKDLSRGAKQNGLSFLSMPEYASPDASPTLHPFIAPYPFAVPCGESASLTRAVEESLLGAGVGLVPESLTSAVDACNDVVFPSLSIGGAVLMQGDGQRGNQLGATPQDVQAGGLHGGGHHGGRGMIRENGVAGRETTTRCSICHHGTACRCGITRNAAAGSMGSNGSNDSNGSFLAQELWHDGVPGVPGVSGVAGHRLQQSTPTAYSSSSGTQPRQLSTPGARPTAAPWVGRQYFHEHGLAVVRILKDGVLVIPNRTQEVLETSAKSDLRNLLRVIRGICQAHTAAYLAINQAVHNATADRQPHGMMDTDPHAADPRLGGRAGGGGGVSLDMDAHYNDAVARHHANYANYGAHGGGHGGGHGGYEYGGGRGGGAL